jgi:4a-hydroxytetrahydrobiopterin dehydratase
VRLVQAIATAAGDAGPHHPDVDLQHDTVTVRLLTATPDYTGMTTGDVELAVRISDLAPSAPARVCGQRRAPDL